MHRDSRLWPDLDRRIGASHRRLGISRRAGETRRRLSVRACKLEVSMPNADPCHAASRRLRVAPAPPTLPNGHRHTIRSHEAQLKSKAGGLRNAKVDLIPARWDPTIFGTMGGGTINHLPAEIRPETDQRNGEPRPQTYSALYSARAGAFSPPRLASLGSGPDRPLLGLFKSRSGTLWIWDGQHEAHFVRRSGAERFGSQGPIGELLRCSSHGAHRNLKRPARFPSTLSCAPHNTAECFEVLSLMRSLCASTWCWALPHLPGKLEAANYRLNYLRSRMLPYLSGCRRERRR
jgi:hypothetical protein